MACLVVARRAEGALPAAPFLAATGLLAAVDLALTAVVRVPDRGGAAMWNWGVVGVTILGFAAFRPVRDVLLVAAGHSLLAVAVTATALHQPGVGAFNLLIVANAAATPALAAAQYLNLYIRAVRLREQAAAQRRAIQTRHAAEEAIEADAAGRLQSLRAEVVPLLTGVAEGSVAVDDPQVARLARRLGADLRRELIAARSGQWLLATSRPAPRDNKPGDNKPGDNKPGDTQLASPGSSADLLDPHRLLGRLRDADRAALAALLDVLHRYSDWPRLSVALAPEGGHPAHATITVVATGPDARAAAQDTAVVAAARQFGAHLHLETSDVLVAETSMALGRLSPWALRHVVPRNAPGCPGAVRNSGHARASAVPASGHRG